MKLGQHDTGGHESTRILRSNDYKTRLKHVWDKKAPSYDQQDTFHRRLAEKLVDLSDISSGLKIVDISHWLRHLV